MGNRSTRAFNHGDINLGISIFNSTGRIIMEEDKDMTNENEDNEIENAEYDGGVMTMSAKGMTYKSEDNEIATVEYAWKTNREGLYRTLSNQINEKLNQAIQGLEYEGMVDPLVLYFSCHTIARHFYNQLEAHGWNVTIDQDNDIVQVDLVGSIDQADKDMDVISQAHYFSQSDLDNLN